MYHDHAVRLTRVTRVIGPALAVLLLAGVAALAIVPRLRPAGDDKLVTVHALVGSEKRSFLTDPEVVSVLARAGYRLVIDTAGSREITTRTDLDAYDLVFPANTPQADRIKQARGLTRSYSPFYSPMAIATFRPIADLLARAGVVHTDGPVATFDMHAYLKLVRDHTRWSDLPGADAVYPTDRSVLIASTDVRTSNSAALYLALVSYVANGDEVVTDRAAAERQAEFAAGLFERQGYLDNSTAEPFDEFLAMGMGKAPMVMIYEAQFLERVRAADGSIRPDMLLLYPEPTIFARHTVVPLTDTGDAVGKLLSTSPDLVRLAVRHGFRPSDPAAAAQARGQGAANAASAPPELVNTAEPPSQEISDLMIELIADAYRTGTG
ncbi:hypothetical protein Ga0074812_10764 [Parafrankia irregularis]|uniref:Extracellular solute-binding protein n=1 Tax=Parafrankia irregularis TaxID=795642 RepID=A0A0S4QLJ9_9ACTN|nr:MULTISPECIES: hypothetical protein [Parafrankia]MBE3201364.1 hypothetical protein [Parafrankia sp. CH37]CUU56180.1 hypothetical protein Ga0074812_10764 [Parafrankia irregularis]